jgi:hypothetical protein
MWKRLVALFSSFPACLEDKHVDLNDYYNVFAHSRRVKRRLHDVPFGFSQHLLGGFAAAATTPILSCWFCRYNFTVIN